MNMNMHKIFITKNTNGDTRVADHVPSFEEFHQANIEHRNSVKDMMLSFSDEVIVRAFAHDHTKTDDGMEDIFYHDLCETIYGNMKFTDGEWAKIHYDTERHHLHERVPEDVNLLDVIEMIADCVCAGYARSGNVRSMELNKEILEKAFDNTVQMFSDSVEIVNRE